MNPTGIKYYIDLCRPDHWIKNVFIVPGILLHLFFHHIPLSALDARRLIVGLAGIFLVASANYVFNEILDAASDRFHPSKKFRPIPSGNVRVPAAYALWGALSLAGIGAGFLAGGIYLGATGAALWLAGIMYNMPPIRLKDRIYLDVVSESLNNPLRLLAGWYMAAPVNGLPPPVSVLIAYWMFGAFLMAIKRYAEFREIDDAVAAGQYRRSFRFYNLERLQESIVFYAAAFAFFSGVFIARYRMELILAIPVVAYCLAYYFHLGFKPNSPVQHPERLYRERKLMVLVSVTFAACTLLLWLDIPDLQTLFSPRVPEVFPLE